MNPALSGRGEQALQRHCRLRDIVSLGIGWTAARKVLTLSDRSHEREEDAKEKWGAVHELGSGKKGNGGPSKLHCDMRTNACTLRQVKGVVASHQQGSDARDADTDGFCQAASNLNA